MARRDQLYGRQWRKARRLFLSNHPLCLYCQQQGKVTPATVVDHKTPHQGDSDLFWDPENWQPLCKRHHDSTKQAEEKSGTVLGCGIDGRPLDASHHWNGGKDGRGGG